METTPAATPSKYTVLAIVAVGVFMCTLDSSIVNVSLPVIAQHFGVPVGAEIEWVLIAYLVVIASTLLVVGRLADRTGRRPIWAAGLVVFTLGSALCGAAPSLTLLVMSRVLQGVGGSFLMAVSPAMLVGAFPANERGRALGMNATIVALGITTGPALGGVITAQASWRWIFYINVPIGIAGVIATLSLLPHDGKDTRGRERTRFDLGGAALLACALAAVTAALSVGNSAGWTSTPVLALAAVTVVAAASFAVREHRQQAPLLDRALFADRLFVWATASLVISFLAAFATAFLMPIYLEKIRGFPLVRVGLLLTPFPLVVAVVAPLSGAAADRVGTRWLAAGGMTVLAVGLVLLAALDEHAALAHIVGAQVVAALGMGLFQSPNNSALMGAAPKTHQGVAAGMLGTGRTMGQALSVALAGAVFAAGGGGVPGFRDALLVCAAIAVVGIIVSLLRGRER